MESSRIQLMLSPQGWVSQLVFCVCWTPKEGGSNATEGTDVLARWGQAGKELKLPSSLSLYRLPAEGLTQTKGVSFFPPQDRN